GDRVPDTPGLGEWQIFPRTNWYWALADLDSAGSWPVHRGEVPEAPLALGRATVLHAQGCEFPQWRRDGASAAQPPLSPVTDRPGTAVWGLVARDATPLVRRRALAARARLVEMAPGEGQP